jgi:hypothetical protein
MALHITTVTRLASTALLSGTLALSAVASKAIAQTLTNPSPATKTQPIASKSAGTKRMKACPEYGAGFARMPGSDACIKIGGFVEGGISGGDH